MSASAADLEHATSALLAAMDELQKHAGPTIPYEVKRGSGPVTAADRAVDALLRARLPRPGEGWLSEESDDDRERLGTGRVWVVDPLDGTRSFVARRPEYSVSIALLEDGEPVLGAVGNPATGVVVRGGAGLGVVATGDPRLAWNGASDALRVLCSRSEYRRGEWAPYERLGLAVLPLGSVAYSLALVAGGFADATWTLQPEHEWDVAAGAALVRAAGGEVWSPGGASLRWNHHWPRLPDFAAAGPGRVVRARAAIAGL